MNILIAVSSERVPDSVSYAIMRWYGWDGSHIFAVIEEDDRMFHAIGEGVCDHNFTEFCKEHHITHSKAVKLNVDKEGFYKWYRELEKEGNIEYSNWQYVGFLVPFLRRFSFVSNKRKKAICSEFVCWLLSDLAGVDVGDGDFKDPKCVWERVEAI